MLFLRGLITEIDFAECEQAFPGIERYYRELQEKPCTFLELVWRYTRAVCPCHADDDLAAPSAGASVSR
jgi:hypothetical protein